MGSAARNGRAVKRLLAAALALLALAAPALAQRADRASPGFVRVRLETTKGDVIIAVDERHAPITATNFLKYVDDGRLDGTSFFRASRNKANPKVGFIEGGIGTDARRSLLGIPLEPTSKTGLHHVDGAISMARNGLDSATGNFSIFVGAAPGYDARPGAPGYAVFARVVSGMDTVKAILAAPSGAGEGVMKGQMILAPVIIKRAVRLDGTPRPTGGPKVWLLKLGG
ncbi:peptidylprolyl isomerase [Sphingomonas sp. GlSt437]|uniref:peptidylprolyl isomerase n=1 Tax=Sphingomonas sp. GlSt437 TaxID=3389970 RepID=UPI003A8A2AE3